MTLSMKERLDVEKGEDKMIINALKNTKSIKQTSMILEVSEERVRKIAETNQLLVIDWGMSIWHC